MDQDTRAPGPPVSGAVQADTPGSEQQRSPGEIRAEIEETREELGDTVAALADKTDIKGQTQQRMAAVKENLARKRDELTAKARNATPDGAQQGGRQVVTTVRQHPAPVAVAGAAVAGFLLGRLTRRPGYEE
jgi:ElaB/YqjD/DUF883 family membrane-anchored ribosome-binding protein